ncbi:hypothetical protein GCK32_020605, partial [Trichostrongylus colubriformis]
MCTSSIVFVMISLLSCQSVVAQFDHSTCGTQKGCISAPPECQGDSCFFHFSYKPDGDHIILELAGTPAHSNGYLAVGFSEDEKM